MARFGSFAGGLAGGLASGYRLGLEVDEAEERKKDREITREKDRIGLELARGQAESVRKEREYKTEREKFIRENTMDPVQGYDEITGAQSGISYRQRQLSDADMMRVYEGIGALEFRHGKLEPEKAIAMSRTLKAAREEGAFDAYNEYLRTGDPVSVERVFNQRGSMKIAPGSVSLESRIDDQTGQRYNVLKAKRADGGDLVFDPVAVGRAQGGARAYVENLDKAAKAKLEERKVGATESRERTRELREEIRYVAGERRADQRDRQLDIMASRMGRTGGAEGGVFGVKMRMLEENAPSLSFEQRFALASGQRNVPETQIRKWAEDAVAREEKVSGVPFKADVRERKVREKLVFFQGIGAAGEDGDGTGPTPARPRAPAAGGRNYRPEGGW